MSTTPGSTLLQGGSVVETTRTTAIVDEVRRAAADQILRHLGEPEPGLRLRMTVRMWITAVEAASLIWLDEDKQPALDELRNWLVDHFIALLTATAAKRPADRPGDPGGAQAGDVRRPGRRSGPPRPARRERRRPSAVSRHRAGPV